MTREVRICEGCGCHNDISKLECVECGYDLSFVIPVPETNEKPKEHVWGLSADGAAVTIADKSVIGRMGNLLAEFVNTSDFVSREHAVFSIDGGNLFVTDKSTNGTSVNGKAVVKNSPTELKAGDTLELADMKFTVTCDEN